MGAAKMFRWLAVYSREASRGGWGGKGAAARATCTPAASGDQVRVRRFAHVGMPTHVRHGTASRSHVRPHTPRPRCLLHVSRVPPPSASPRARGRRTSPFARGRSGRRTSPFASGRGRGDGSGYRRSRGSCGSGARGICGRCLRRGWGRCRRSPPWAARRPPGRSSRSPPAGPSTSRVASASGRRPRAPRSSPRWSPGAGAAPRRRARRRRRRRCAGPSWRRRRWPWPSRRLGGGARGTWPSCGRAGRPYWG